MGSLLLVAPNVDLVDVDRIEEGVPIPVNPPYVSNYYNQVLIGALPEPKALLLTMLWSEEPDVWLRHRDKYHVVGLHDGRPMMSRRPISLTNDVGNKVKIVSRGDQKEAKDG